MPREWPLAVHFGGWTALAEAQCWRAVEDAHAPLGEGGHPFSGSQYITRPHSSVPEIFFCTMDIFGKTKVPL